MFAQTSLSVSDENWNSRVSEAGGLLAMYFWYFDPVGRDLVLSGLEIDLSIADEIMQSSLKNIFNVSKLQRQVSYRG